MSFSAQIASWSSKTNAKQQAIRKAVAIKLFSAVVLDTPVLTGRLRGNWIYQTGAANLTTRETVDPSGSIVIKEITDGVNANVQDVPVYLANSLPYAERIEFEGWSHTKAPEGMMRKNVARFNQLLEAEAAK